MPVWLRRTLIALAALLVLAVAAGAWLIASFDPNRYKGELIEAMRDKYGRTLAIDGPIGLSLFPRIEVTLRDVKLSEHGRAAEFVSLREAALAVQVLPLLREQLAIDRVQAKGVRVVYTRDAAGRSNIDDLLGAPDKPEPPASRPSEAGGAPRFDVRAIELSDLQATVQDVPLGIDGRFIVQQLSTGRLADGAQSPLKFVGQAALTRPALNAKLELGSRVRISLPAGAPASIAFDELQLALQGEGFQVKQLDAKLSGALAYDGASGALRADTLKLALSGERLGLALKDSALSLERLRLDPAKRSLQLTALDLKLAGRSGEQAIDASLAWPTLEVTGDALKGSALKGRATLKGAQSVQLAFESQAPSGSFERIRVPGLKLTVTGSGAGRSVRGEVGSELSFAPAPFSAALDALNLKLAFTDPALPPMNLAVQGSAKASAKDASWLLDGAINEQKFNATGRADLSRPVPRVEAQAKFASLDLTRFVAPAAAKKPAGASAPAGGPGGDQPVDLSGLKALDGAFGLRAGTLVYPPYRVSDAVIDATLSGGVLRVAQLAGRSWGGRFNAQASADANTQRIGFKLDAADVNIAALLKDVAQFEKLEGTGRVTADVATRGASVGQLRQRLEGKSALQLRDGAVRGINLARVLRQWRSAVSLNQDAVQSSSAVEKTDFSEISASFDIRDGVARNKDLAAKSPFLRVGGEGAIDIGRGRIDYLAKATVTATPEGQGGADLAALKGITVPVQLTGPFEAVDYRVQWSAVAAELLARRAGDALGGKGAVGELLKGLGGARAPAGGASAPGAAASTPRDQLKDRLKGLLGR